jgi:hypothetical protein
VWRHKNIKQDKLVQLFDITIYTSSSFSLIASSPNTTEEEEDKEDTKRTRAFVLLLCSVIVLSLKKRWAGSYRRSTFVDDGKSSPCTRVFERFLLDIVL